MLIKLSCLRNNLVDNKDGASCRIVTKEYINVVTVNTFRTSNVAVGIVHFLLPFLTATISATTNTAFRILNRNIISVNVNMSFLIVASFLLCICGVGIHLCLFLCNLLR